MLLLLLNQLLVVLELLLLLMAKSDQRGNVTGHPGYQSFSALQELQSGWFGCGIHAEGVFHVSWSVSWVRVGQIVLSCTDRRETQMRHVQGCLLREKGGRGSEWFQGQGFQWSVQRAVCVSPPVAVKRPMGPVVDGRVVLVGGGTQTQQHDDTRQRYSSGRIQNH